MHPSEKFRQNLLFKSYFIKDFNFLTQELKRRKIYRLEFGVEDNKYNISNLVMCFLSCS